MLHTKPKHAIQSYVLTRLAAPIWGTPSWVLRLPYNAIACPATAHSGTTWRAPLNTSLPRKGVGDELQILENQCIRSIAGAYNFVLTQSFKLKVSNLSCPYIWTAGRPNIIEDLQSHREI
jgi:hypothetical protein